MESETWTFFGHWDAGAIVLDGVKDGVVEDQRDDDGRWPEGLWAAVGSGATVDEAYAAVLADYVRMFGAS